MSAFEINIDKIEVKKLSLGQTIGISAIFRKFYQIAKKSGKENIFELTERVLNPKTNIYENVPKKLNKDIIMGIIFEQIVDEYDYINSQFGELTKLLFRVISNITSIPVDVLLEMDLDTFIKLFKKIASEQEDKIKESFLGKTDTTLPSETEE